jgi:hypothetical protein
MFEAAKARKKKGKNKKEKSKNGAAWTANYATHQILDAYGAGDASKRGNRGFSSLHSAHT